MTILKIVHGKTNRTLLVTHSRRLVSNAIFFHSPAVLGVVLFVMVAYVNLSLLFYSSETSVYPGTYQRTSKDEKECQCSATTFSTNATFCGRCSRGKDSIVPGGNTIQDADNSDGRL